MSILEKIVVAVVGEANLVGPVLGAAGASVEVCTEANLLSLVARGVDAVLFVLGEDPNAVAPAANLLAAVRERPVARVVMATESTSVATLDRFGPATVITRAVDLPMALAGLAAAKDAFFEHEAKARASHERCVAADLAIEETRLELSALSHDARVLFGLVTGYAANLRDGLAGPVVPLQQKHAENIVEAIADATALLERHVASAGALLLRPKKEETTKRALGLRRLVDIAELVGTTATLFQGVATGKGIHLAVDVSTVDCWCDPTQLKQVVVNLMSNALKLTPRGGQVEIQVRRAPALSGSGRSARQEVEIVVSDSGPGVPPSEHERIFERGARLERDQGLPGSGLGLAVVRTIVAAHGGRVRVEEAIFGGASFVVTLPVDMRSRAEDGRRDLPQKPEAE